MRRVATKYMSHCLSKKCKSTIQGRQHPILLMSYINWKLCLNHIFHLQSNLTSISGGFRGGAGRDVRPPPLKSTPKKESVLISLFFHIWWLKMQNFLGSLRSPALFNIIINITLLKNLENNTCSYILSAFYTAATVATGEGYFDMKMQDFGALKSLYCRSFRGASSPWSPHQGSALDLTGDLGGPQTPRRISPPLNTKPGMRAWVLSHN